MPANLDTFTKLEIQCRGLHRISEPLKHIVLCIATKDNRVVVFPRKRADGVEVFGLPRGSFIKSSSATEFEDNVMQIMKEHVVNPASVEMVDYAVIGETLVVLYAAVSDVALLPELFPSQHLSVRRKALFMRLSELFGPQLQMKPGMPTPTFSVGGFRRVFGVSDLAVLRGLQTTSDYG